MRMSRPVGEHVLAGGDVILAGLFSAMDTEIDVSSIGWPCRWRRRARVMGRHIEG
jgi:hypothetical protein